MTSYKQAKQTAEKMKILTLPSQTLVKAQSKKPDQSKARQTSKQTNTNDTHSRCKAKQIYINLTRQEKSKQNETHEQLCNTMHGPNNIK